MTLHCHCDVRYTDIIDIDTDIMYICLQIKRSSNRKIQDQFVVPVLGVVAPAVHHQQHEQTIKLEQK